MGSIVFLLVATRLTLSFSARPSTVTSTSPRLKFRIFPAKMPPRRKLDIPASLVKVLLSRSKNSTEILSSSVGLGFVWSHVDAFVAASVLLVVLFQIKVRNHHEAEEGIEKRQRRMKIFFFKKVTFKKKKKKKKKKK